MDLLKLHDPFELDAIEWRVQQCGAKNGKPWAMVLCYVTNRAIMDRLDEVCGPANWRNEYREAPQGGVMCGISIKVEGEWVTKWDGAENTDIEKVKGGLSGAMKRAAVQWGIGRYLYRLEAGFAKVHPGGKFKAYDKQTKTGFKWDPPALPKWAIPTKQPKPVEQFERPTEEPDHEPEPKRQAQPEQPPAKTWNDLSTGKQKQIAIRRKELADSIEWAPKYSGYDEWIESAGLLSLKPDGKPSFAVSTVDQIDRVMGFLEKLAQDRPKQPEDPKPEGGLPVSEATRQEAATANGVIDPRKFDPEPNEWAAKSQNDFSRDLRNAETQEAGAA